VAAKDFIPVPGRSNIYVFREKGVKGKVNSFRFFLDGRFMGGIAVGAIYYPKHRQEVHSISAFSH